MKLEEQKDENVEVTQELRLTRCYREFLILLLNIQTISKLVIVIY